MRGGAFDGELVPIGAHVGLGGVAIFGSDIGGYTAVRTPPTTKWTPTTSSASSKPNFSLMRTAYEQMTPAMRPMKIGDAPATKPAAGVMATRPATMPDAAPRFVG